MDALEWLRKQLDGDGDDLLREMVREFGQRLMAAEVDALTGASWGEVSAERVNHRNGYRTRPFDTRVGSIELAIPKLRRTRQSRDARVATSHVAVVTWWTGSVVPSNAHASIWAIAQPRALSRSRSRAAVRRSSHGLLERTRGAGLPVELRVTGERRPLPPGVELSAYRIVQEDLRVVGQADNGRQAIEEARRLSPDVVLMDVPMPVLLRPAWA